MREYLRVAWKENSENKYRVIIAYFYSESKAWTSESQGLGSSSDFDTSCVTLR